MLYENQYSPPPPPAKRKNTVPELTEPTSLEISFWEALALIATACVFVPLFKRLGLGTILGYLATGVVIGTFLSLGLAEHPQELLHFAEFGVVLFLFIIGLELEPSRLWSMRHDIFGLGLMQVLVCGVALSVPPLLFGFSWQISLIIGLGLALSSTALVMQVLEESGERGSIHGRKTFSILLFQDLAIVPLLLLVELLAPSATEIALGEALLRVAMAIAAIVLLIAVGKFLLDPIFRLLAGTKLTEIMTASALGVVIAAALLMDLVGMSYAMGAFIAGVMLAESSYRHEVEANIEPFRGLFLGLFFIAVGMSLNLGTVAGNWAIILIAVALFMTIKCAAIYCVTRTFATAHNPAVLTAFSLAQHGEFGFVLFASAASIGLLNAQTNSILVAIITLSMGLAPLARRLANLALRAAAPDTIEEDFSDANGQVLIIGFGRFGQVVSQPLLARDTEITIIDSDPARVREAGRFGSRIHFGDGSRRDVLRAAGAADASLIIVCVDNIEQANAIVRIVQSDFGQAKLFVRSYDRRHSVVLWNAKVDYSVRETFESGLLMSSKALAILGYDDEAIIDTIADVRKRDIDRLTRQAAEAADAAEIKPKPLRKRHWRKILRRTRMDAKAMITKV